MDIYFAGSQCIEADTLMQDKNYCRLLSYFNDKSTMKKWFERKRNNETQSSIIIDSGAFSAWTKEIEIDVDEYLEFIDENKDVVNYWGQLDAIPGTPTSKPTNDMVEASAEATWENYLYMRSRMEHPDTLLYTFHIGTPFKYLERALMWRDPKTGLPIKQMAFGGMVGKHIKLRMEFMDRAFEIINRLSPGMKVHGFGMTSFSLMPKYPLNTVDSTSWIRTSSFGNIYTEQGLVLVSSEGKSKPEHFDHLPEIIKEHVAELAREAGYTVEDLATDYKARMCYNLVYVHEWVKSMKKEHSTIVRKGLF